jgi:hypothetical protein
MTNEEFFAAARGSSNVATLSKEGKKPQEETVEQQHARKKAELSTVGIVAI